MTENETVQQFITRIAPPKPNEVIGIVDSYGAVHGVPHFDSSPAHQIFIHEDVFGACQKRWRYRPGVGFHKLDDCDGVEEYELDAEQEDHVRQFLIRRGWL